MNGKMILLKPQPPMLFWLKYGRRAWRCLADHLLCPDLDDTIRDFAAQLRKGGATSECMSY